MTDQHRRRLRERLDHLSPRQRVWLAERLGLPDQVSQGTAQGLLAYVSSSGETTFDARLVRDFAAERLPDYMLPRIVPLDGGLPRTASGKVDRGALAAMEAPKNANADGMLMAARTKAESILSEIWSEVLSVDELSVEDNFFELGGDSLLSIRILARARQRGLLINPEHFFTHPTIAGQAAAAEIDGGQKTEVGPVEGTAPLTPIQQWFLAHTPVDPHHWNQSMLFAIRATLNRSLIEQALKHLMQHHDGLRLHLQREGSRRVQALADLDAPVPFSVIDLESIAPDTVHAKIHGVENDWHAELNLEKAPLFRVGLFRTPAQTPDRLLLLAHHLLVDAVSWRILIEDLTTALEQLQQGRTVALPVKTTSGLTWARRIYELAGTDDLSRQANWWLEQGKKTAARLPCDYESLLRDNRVSSTVTVNASLSADDTGALINDVPQVYHTQVLDVLLAAFSTVLGRWMGGDWLQVDLERHGRQPVAENIDVSRTLGWFTCVFPVWLPCHGDLGDRIKLTKEALRAVPMEGLGHGLLRYLCPDERTRKAVAAVPDSEVCFNYLGQLGSENGLLAVEREGGGKARSPQGLRAYLLEVNLWVVDGCLESAWHFSDRFHALETMQQLAQAFVIELSALIAHCHDPSVGGHTPSDFPLAGLDQNELDNLSTLLDEKDGE